MLNNKNSTILTVVDIFQSKIREENRLGKTKQELLDDINIFKALGDSCMTNDQYNKIIEILNDEFLE